MTAPVPPVVVFGYDRPAHLQRTLRCLAATDGARETPLYLFCDGPKAGTDPVRLDAVRYVASDPGWARSFAFVELFCAQANKGLASSIIDGVTTVLERHERVIVLEDDLLVSPDFLTYMNAALAAYADRPSVGSVTGFCPLPALPAHYAHGVMAVPRNCSHGWGTWRDRWDRVTWDTAISRRVWQDRNLRRRLNSAGDDRLSRLRRQALGEIDSWSIRFGAWQVAEGLDTIYPRDNRVLNLGFDGTGVHCGEGAPINDVLATDPTLPDFDLVAPDPAILRAFRKAYSGPYHRRIARKLRLAFVPDPT
ncbi:hypothetical protein [Maritimibacter dapengensis]|uniref:Glycosyl transferase family 2 n=1 Tax=Maritimibacter dapengensis TaxID=2836868 RepID=A0ABS6SYZ8_9RHOB|nr:hypothetical protein [Maritimibacter dapengensis]MBV7377955.1 hypothetical protein [Maritimibacter dapengensis]